MSLARVEFKPNATDDVMRVERALHGEIVEAPTDTQLGKAIQRVGFAAWRNTEWAQRIASQNGMSVDDLVARAFNPQSPHMCRMQTKRVRDSAHSRRTEYWSAEILPRSDDGQVHTPGDTICGFVKVSQERVGNRVTRALQRSTGTGGNVCLHDIDVMPAYQRSGMGTALAYVALGDQPRHLGVSMDIGAGNEPMSQWAYKYGFCPTEEIHDTELFDGVEAVFIRHRAPSVNFVLNTMVQHEPWLVQSNRIDLEYLQVMGDFDETQPK
jgi:hypothetical protein